jgi:hypothetical protein
MADNLNWGCPDWRNVEAYGIVDEWDFARWRWEFKRRTSRVRHMFQFKVLDEFRANNPGFAYRFDVMWSAEYRDRVFPLSGSEASEVGYSALPNPLYSDNAALEFEGAQSLEARTIMGFHLNKVASNDWHPLDVLGYLKVAIIFDPNKPLAPQMAGLEEYLISLRNHNFPDDIQRKQMSKWLTYLRILDAAEKEASYSEIASVVLPPHNARTEQSARDALRQAKELQSRI